MAANAAHQPPELFSQGFSIANEDITVSVSDDKLIQHLRSFIPISPGDDLRVFPPSGWLRGTGHLFAFGNQHGAVNHDGNGENFCRQWGEGFRTLAANLCHRESR